MRTVLMAFLMLLAGPALAQSVELPWQGRLLDSTGLPTTGTDGVTFTLKDGAGTTLWEKYYPSVSFDNGYANVSLSGADDQATAVVLDGELTTEVASITLALDSNPSFALTMPVGSTARAASVVGTVDLTNSNADCSASTPATAGTLRWTGTDLQLCDGLAWITLHTGALDGSDQVHAAASCDQLHTDFPLLPDGQYSIDPLTPGNTADAFEAWCEMDEHSGGWTLCLSNVARGKGSAISDSNTWWTTDWEADGRVLTVGNTDQGTNWGNFCPEIAATATEIYASVHSEDNTETVGDTCTLNPSWWTADAGHMALTCTGSTLMSALPKSGYNAMGCTNCIYRNDETTPNTTGANWTHNYYGTHVIVRLGGASAYGPNGIHWGYVNEGMSDPSNGGDVHCGENTNWCYERYWNRNSGSTPNIWKKSMQLYVR